MVISNQHLNDVFRDINATRIDTIERFLNSVTPNELSFEFSSLLLLGRLFDRLLVRLTFAKFI